MPDFELNHETNVNEVVDDVLETTVELLHGVAEKTLQIERQRAGEHMKRNL